MRLWLAHSSQSPISPTTAPLDAAALAGRQNRYQVGDRPVFKIGICREFGFTERRRSRTYRAVGYTTAPVSKV
jgi:hypothetical protein